MKQVLATWVTKNLPALLAFNLRIAAFLGAPNRFTLSANAYRAERDKKVLGRFFRPTIDKLFWWLFAEKNHCYAEYVRISKQLELIVT